MQDLLKYSTFALLSVVLASPLNGVQQRDTFVWGALGDSWASGVSYDGGVSFDGKNTDYDNNKNECLRWKNTYGPLMEANTTWTTKPQDFHLAACAGAFLDNIQQILGYRNPPQMDQVGNPMMLTYQAGANNCGFGTAVAKCLYPLPGLLGYDKPYPDPDGDCAKQVHDTNTYINDMRTDPSYGFHGLYQDEIATVRNVLGHTAVKDNPDFRLYVLGYAHFFNLGSNYCDNLSFAALNANYQPPNVTNQLRTDFNDAITRVNNILRKVVHDVGDPRAKFIDISPAFNGHRFCEDNHNAKDQWFNNDVWLWNLNWPSQDPPTDPLSLAGALIVNGTMPAPVSISSLNGTVGDEMAGARDMAWVMRPFHPKIGGTLAIAEYIMAAAMADKIPGVVGSDSAASPRESTALPATITASPTSSTPHRPYRTHSLLYLSDQTFSH
ncbi:hypothetical protein OIDMADRAFT_58609 [Oidiodendron maius Zn]|uniref:SGNH hydrolase-type esterase domain-containing protein n=1 Tax=Oidiodendron maius (strain Zn) TaxID=913774 RepID=A0A0C3CBG6_OIDMZ|nr:hypothetical protein OIDMADRAFT_58609 [Oidiodendron maius Zn]